MLKHNNSNYVIILIKFVDNGGNYACYIVIVVEREYVGRLCNGLSTVGNKKDKTKVGIGDIYDIL